MHFVKKHSHFILILIGSFIWSLTMIKSGLVYRFGMGFWGANGHDGIWHLAMANQLSRWDFQMPVFAGETIKNYHLGFDLLLALFHRLTFIPVSTLYFQILPPVLALLFGLSVYMFVKDWKANKSVALLALFFAYFGGSWGWLVNLIRSGSWGGESMFWAQQGISTLINPPFALSLIFMSLGLLFLRRYLSRPRPKYFLATGLLFGLLPLIKVYAGILSLCGLLVVVVYDYISHRRLGPIKLFVFTLILSALVFLPFNRGSSGLIVFKPFWFLDSLLSVSDRFNWPRLFNAMLAYRQTGNLFRLLLGYVLALVIFIVGNLGTRIVGFNYLKSFRRFGPLEYFLLTVFLVGLFIPTAFIQSGTPWNTIQFFYYSLFALNIFAAIAFADLLKHIKNRSGRSIALLILVILTAPTTLDTLKHYLPGRPPAMISREELDGLKFLARQPPGVVFEYPSSPDAYAPAPRPLYLYESTAYVSALSGHPSYLADTVNLNITGYNWPVRRDLSFVFVNQASPSAAVNFLAENQIRYIYLPVVSKYRPVLSATQLGGRVIFENSQVSIWEIAPAGKP